MSIVCILIIPILDYLLILEQLSQNYSIDTHPISPFLGLGFLSLFPLAISQSLSYIISQRVVISFSNVRQECGWITLHFKLCIPCFFLLAQIMENFHYISHSWYLKRVFSYHSIHRHLLWSHWIAHWRQYLEEKCQVTIWYSF